MSSGMCQCETMVRGGPSSVLSMKRLQPLEYLNTVGQHDMNLGFEKSQPDVTLCQAGTTLDTEEIWSYQKTESHPKRSTPTGNFRLCDAHGQ